MGCCCGSEYLCGELRFSVTADLDSPVSRRLLLQQNLISGAQDTREICSEWITSSSVIFSLYSAVTGRQCVCVQLAQTRAIFFISFLHAVLVCLSDGVCFTLHTPVAFFIDVSRPRVASFIDLHIIFHLLCQATPLAHTLAGNLCGKLWEAPAECYIAKKFAQSYLVYTYDLYPGE